MKLEDAENLALTLMEDNGVGTWSFRFDNAKRRCGACFYSRRTITLSRHFVTLNDEAEVRDTILHEIAHAFAGAKAGHTVCTGSAQRCSSARGRSGARRTSTCRKVRSKACARRTARRATPGTECRRSGSLTPTRATGAMSRSRGFA